MSLPHQCECRICGRTMNDLLPGVVFKPLFAPGESRNYWACTKHGIIQGPECEQCLAERGKR